MNDDHPLELHVVYESPDHNYYWFDSKSCMGYYYLFISQWKDKAEMSSVDFSDIPAMHLTIRREISIKQLVMEACENFSRYVE